MDAVRANGWAFRFASAARRADRELVAVAVEAHGRNLCYVSDERLRSDRELMLHCVSRNAWALNWCDDSLRNDPVFLKEAVGKNGWALPYAHHAHTSNAGLARSAAGQGSEYGLSRLKDIGLMSSSPDGHHWKHGGGVAPFGKSGHDGLLPPQAAVDPEAVRRVVQRPWRDLNDYASRPIQVSSSGSMSGSLEA